MSAEQNQPAPLEERASAAPSGAHAPGAMANAAWNIFSTVWGMVISFVLAPLMIHHLGTDQYGLLLLVWSVTGILGVMNIGLGEATLRYVAHYYNKGEIAAVNRVMGTSLSLVLLLSVVIAGAFIFATPLVVGFIKSPIENVSFVSWLLRIAAVIVALNVFSWTYSAIPMALHRYDIVSKLTVVQSVVRSGGYIALVLSGFGILHLLLWDLLTQAATLLAYVLVVRRITPDIRLLPSMSFNGLREIFSYSVSSLFCFIFLKVRCEAGKIVLGTQLGASPVAYLGTPDNVANRLHVLVSSGAETLLPRFSAERQSSVAQRLFLNATWASLVSSLVLLLPLVLLFPDFLRLWIGAEFARESALVGQLVAISYIFHGAYAPAGAYFRGIGRPWLVTLVVGLAAGTILLGSVLLIPSHGVAGVGYAYALGSVPALIGLVHCWFYLFGREWGGLLRSVGLPLVLAGAVMLLERTVLTWLLPLTWVSLAGLGMAFVALMSLALFGADWLLGGENPPSRQFLGNVLRSRRVMSLKRRLPFGRRGRVAS